MRRALVESVGECERCGTSPKHPRYRPLFLNDLCCHEILNGPLRDKVLDEPSCLIVSCDWCNKYIFTGKAGNQPWDWLAQQLAVIKARAPDRYDLQRVLELRNPNAMRFVTEEDVDEWIEKDGLALISAESKSPRTLS